MSLLDKWQRFEAGNPTLDMTRAQIVDVYVSMAGRASHWLSSYYSSTAPGGDESIQVEAVPNDQEDLGLDLLSDLGLAPVLEHGGVRVIETRGRAIDQDEDHASLSDLVIYSGYLDYTSFGVGFGASCALDAPGCSGTSPDYGWGGSAGATPEGAYPGTTPTGMGSATWTGVMIGMEASEFDAAGQAAVPAWVHEGPDVYLGDAQVRIGDLVAPDVDVSFTSIHNVTEGTGRPDMRWEGLPVTNGLFASGDFDDGYIAGMFSGPGHEEVAGEFLRDGITGSFRALRTEYRYPRSRRPLRSRNAAGGAGSRRERGAGSRGRRVPARVRAGVVRPGARSHVRRRRGGRPSVAVVRFLLCIGAR